MFLTGKEISNSVSKVVPLIVVPFRISTDQRSFLWKLLNVKNVMWNTINDAVCRNCQSTLRSAIYRISWPKIPVQILLIVIDVWLKSLCTVQIGIPSMNSSRYVLSSSSESELSSICMTDHMHASSSIQFRLSTLKQNTFHDSIEHHVAFEISTFHHCAANTLSQSRTHPHCKVFRRTTFEGMRHISFEKLYGRIRHLVILKRILINDNIVLIQRKSQLEDIDICNKLAHQCFERWFQLPSASDS